MKIEIGPGCWHPELSFLVVDYMTRFLPLLNVMEWQLSMAIGTVRLLISLLDTDLQFL